MTNDRGKIILPRQQQNITTMNKLYQYNEKDTYLYTQYAYLLGVVLGDGSLTEHTKFRYVHCLKVSCDIKYPNIINSVKIAMKHIMPRNSVNTHTHNNDSGNPSWTDVYCYSQDWKLFFPFFKPGKGKKSSYKIQLTDWQKRIICEHPKEFLRGLIQTDGHRTIAPNKYQYVRYGFSQKSTDIKNIFLWVCNLLSLKPTIYRRKFRAPEYGTGKIWAISLCKGKDTEFLDSFIGPKN